MQKNKLLICLCLLCFATIAKTQRTEIKHYNAKSAGDVKLVSSYGEFHGNICSRVYVINISRTDYYYFNALANMIKGEGFKVYIDDIAFEYVYAGQNGWQYASIASRPVYLKEGRHQVRIFGESRMVPMMEEIFLTTNAPLGRQLAPAAVNAFLDKCEALKQQPIISSGEQERDDFAGKILSNPEGQYGHAIDTSFGYSNFTWVYLSPGNYQFTTNGSTASRSLTIFNPSDYTQSWSNVNSGAGGESLINLSVTSAAYYIIMLRPTTNGNNGTTNILQNGSVIINGAVIGGKTIDANTTKGGPLNFFTCRLTTGDTRLITSRHFASSARAYNDDYSGSGDWSWGYASRIKKDFGTDSVRYGFVCAYSPTSTGLCDVYLGNENSNVYAANYPEFPLLKPDDAIKAAPQSGYYNCISWSGGITSTWVWPPSEYSTYNCTGSYGDITCFDNFYSNNPVRYPGAWNYTRTGATITNATVDLWKLGSSYTHASVRKPGNDHPHGYDWESKPGSLTRTFHPRNALTNNSFGYGAVTNYYKHTGGFARNAGADKAIESDVDAVKAGLAVFDVAVLSSEASQKLRVLTNKVDRSFAGQFNSLYEDWKRTWDDNALYSDPSLYCKNPEHNALVELAAKNNRAAMVLVFEKFVGGDHLIGDLMWTLTKGRYAHLLAEVKAERAASPNDPAGRYKIHGDHDNGVLYVEKILRVFEDGQELAVDDTKVIVSPNPASDRLSVQVITTKPATISVNMVSTQTRLTKTIQPEINVAPGTHQFTTSIQGFAGRSGDIIAVNVTVNGVEKIVKVLVAK